MINVNTVQSIYKLVYVAYYMSSNFIDNIMKNRDFFLTPLRKDILTVILDNKGGMKAYDILTAISSIRGETKAITVYRVLNFLVRKRVLHKIISKNIFILCSSTDDEHKDNSVFLVCKNCNSTNEIHDTRFLSNLNKFYTHYNFALGQDTVELGGYCTKCHVSAIE